MSIDEKEICKLLESILIRKGYQITATTNGREAINAIKKTKFDLVLLDLKLPGMNGVTVLKEIKNSSPEVQVVIITAYPDSELLFKAMELSPVTVIAKPFNTNRIEEVTGKLLD